jgi:LPXTG-site transpeptidase (sortase) family protein
MTIKGWSCSKRAAVCCFFLLFSFFPSSAVTTVQAKPLVLPTTWNKLPNDGLNGNIDNVEALLLNGTDLYVGGGFNGTADGTVTNLNYIVRYSTSGNTWNALANNGLRESSDVTMTRVRSFARVGNYLYVGGQFDETFDLAVTGLNGIARYDLTTNTWSALAHNGLNSNPGVMLAVGTDLYVGGGFTSTFDGAVTNLNCIARYDTLTNTWNALANNGISGTFPGIGALHVVGNDLYVGGQFKYTGDGTILNLNNIARYSLALPHTWSSLANTGLAGPVYTIASIGNMLYLGGIFYSTFDLTITGFGHITSYDISNNTWHALSHGGFNSGGSVGTILAYGTDLYIAGNNLVGTSDHTVANLNNIAIYHTPTDTWSALPNHGFRLLDGGVNRSVGPLEPAGEAIYVGGRMSRTDDDVITGIGGILRLGDNVFPTVTHVSANGFVNTPTSNIVITFSEDVANPAGNGGVDDVTNPANYLIFQAGPNGVYNTAGCVHGPNDDVFISSDSVTYDASLQQATLFINGGANLPNGSYRGLVCGTTSIVDEFANALGGGVDYVFDFTIALLSPGGLPSTGFSPGRITRLPEQPEALDYSDRSGMSLVIPKLGVDLPIVGVPRSKLGWDTTWLNGEVGYLNGTAFPTLEGNAVLTSHVWDANNRPGPFAGIKTLAYGDEIEIHAWGKMYIYEVRSTSLHEPTDLSVLKAGRGSWITLLTCEQYDPQNNSYAFRRAVKAVLMDIRE